jgi:adenylate cyclase
VEKTYTRARELCQQLGETPQLVPVLGNLVVFYFNRGEVQTAHELAEQMMRLAQNVQDQDLLSWAHSALVLRQCEHEGLSLRAQRSNLCEGTAN